MRTWVQSLPKCLFVRPAKAAPAGVETRQKVTIRPFRAAAREEIRVGCLDVELEQMEKRGGGIRMYLPYPFL